MSLSGQGESRAIIFCFVLGTVNLISQLQTLHTINMADKGAVTPNILLNFDFYFIRQLRRSVRYCAQCGCNVLAKF